jgi:hypothetical protein
LVDMESMNKLGEDDDPSSLEDIAYAQEAVYSAITELKTRAEEEPMQAPHPLMRSC